MTNQIQGELLYEGIDGHGTGGSSYVYTPWTTVRGDKATWGIEIVEISSSAPTIQWDVQTRSRESATTTQVITTPQAASAKGTFTKFSDVNAQELVRYRISTGKVPSVSKWAVLRVLQSSWEVDR